MPQTNKDTRLDFSTRAAKVAANGFDFMRAGQSLGSDFADLFGAELDPADYADSALEGMDPADIGIMLGGLAQIDAILSANDGQVRKAVKRLAQFNR